MTVDAAIGDKTCHVYWIHLPDQTDIFTQGYVGITTLSVKKRYQQHQYQSRKGVNYTINKAIRKYGDNLIVDTILVSTLSYCLGVEEKLRPVTGIGYNSAKGGISEGVYGRLNYTSPDEVNIKISESLKLLHKQKPELASEHSKKMKGKQWSESAKLARSMAYKGTQGLAWENSRADKAVWESAPSLYKVVAETPDISLKQLSDIVGINSSKLKVILRKLKSGWNPLDDKSFKEYFKIN